jgi:type I restriction enzyme S subunit
MKYAVGTRKDPNISQDVVRNMHIPFPVKSEQQFIADYLDTKCTEIDNLISIKQQKIEHLKEYKKSIIYEYVTGKKEVEDQDL